MKRKKKTLDILLKLKTILIIFINNKNPKIELI